MIEAEGRRKNKNYDIAAAIANVNLGGGAIPRKGVLIKKLMMSTIHIFINCFIPDHLKATGILYKKKFHCFLWKEIALVCTSYSL